MAESGPDGSDPYNLIWVMPAKGLLRQRASLHFYPVQGGKSFLFSCTAWTFWFCLDRALRQGGPFCRSGV